MPSTPPFDVTALLEQDAVTIVDDATSALERATSRITKRSVPRSVVVVCRRCSTSC
jgi:hypothetical protein